MFRNVVWSETAESCLNKTTNNDAYGAGTMGPEPLSISYSKSDFNGIYRDMIFIVFRGVGKRNSLIRAGYVFLSGHSQTR